MLSVINTGEERTLLQGISWNLYENLLAEIGDNGKARLSYYRGNLEFMTPLPSHENYNRQIDRAIVVIAEELDRDYNLFGSMTIKRADLAAGKEPDSCYYFANEAAVRGKIKLDFNQDPPPDLAIEIDITSSSINQLALYARLGVGEVWRYNGAELVFYQLRSGEYVAVDRSPTFTMLSPDRVLEFLADAQTHGINRAVKMLKEWVQLNR
jgi:Uma2 family endonuclease